MGSSEDIPITKIHRKKIRRILCRLPENLEPGNYRLILTLKDNLGTYHISLHRPVEIVEDEGDF